MHMIKKKKKYEYEYEIWIWKAPAKTLKLI